MRLDKMLFLNIIHGIFLGFSFGMTISILLEQLPLTYTYPYFQNIFLFLAVIGGITGYIKGKRNYVKLFPFLFSTTGTILTPIILSALLYYYLGFEQLLLFPPILFKAGLGLKNLNNQLSTYILSIFITASFIGALISSTSINKKKRWTW